MLRTPLFAALVAGAFAVPAFAQDGAILPGYWAVTNKVSAVISQTKKENRCITPSEVQKFMMGPSNRHYKCDYPTRIFKGGKITLKGKCATRNGHTALLEATGSYSPTTFKMVADIDTSWSGLPLSGRATTEARRISETCPAPAATAASPPA
ncbi:DUF3617 domain-containing protein [Phenylobacterium sp. LH3H17]|uniref:DUF3617 domain-containing protein n=1 Tax=Phenylobacterium sp. LH3H17 TaxID=2903901 RepID=UPI0020C9A8F3|nr:DUF3617 family protein [Phenylobacterium sp. LH3H17]UTP40419.1 DUF3617 domain-containing protein [Phenylobacterium sp. LH3H17]